ncbi:RNA recognition motif. (a.k.a. RRM, RBD, or RNP domain) [Nesidiocoris tenuis]|uniref:RNA-binding protein 42 n=1 Tax=Nesidiocoris tenuis TaxID=355587 RepID=A0ABN7AQZ0_9HEMI|nr:RNA recognition motif. (a.k.a. RRM, RBD, or RNP domain) [Nesidiocoris tenuis]
MALNDEKFKKMQDEMSRFEEEIGLPIPEPGFQPPAATPRIIGTNTYNEAKKSLAGAGHPHFGESTAAPPLGALPPPPPPPPSVPFIPPQVRAMPPMDGPPQFNGGMFRGPLPPPPPMPPGPMPPHLGPPGPMPPGFGMMGPLGPGPMGPGPMPPQMMPVPPQMMQGPPQVFQPITPPRFVNPPAQEVKPQPAATVLSATPMMYVANPQLEIAAMQEANHVNSMMPTEPAIEEPKKSQNKKKTNQVTVETIFTPTQVANPPKKKEKKNKKLIRVAGGQTWEDSTLAEWEDDDFRLFCGDLGNDVTDEVLTRAFSKYPSFLKARVVRDKRTNKTKGFGFVSFKDPQDFIRATKEMNGRYVGSRPIKLRKSSWRNRSMDQVRKKDKEKATLISMLTGR